MPVFSLFQDVDISTHVWKKGDSRPHRHHFFELLYINSGKGIHKINKQKYPYQEQHLFVLVPGDEHSLEVEQTTNFLIISFNKEYLSTQGNGTQKKTNFQAIFSQVEFLLRNASYFDQTAFQKMGSSEFVDVLIRQLISENKGKKPYFEAIIQNTIVQLLCIIAREVQTKLISKMMPNIKNIEINELISYIHANINEPRKLMLNEFASHFNKSKNQLSKYFRNATGFSVKEYIQKYRLNLIKTMLSDTELPISEIAYQFGFTDENHLNKFVKQRLGQTPSGFRRKQA